MRQSFKEDRLGRSMRALHDRVSKLEQRLAELEEPVSECTGIMCAGLLLTKQEDGHYYAHSNDGKHPCVFVWIDPEGDRWSVRASVEDFDLFTESGFSTAEQAAAWTDENLRRILSAVCTLGILAVAGGE